jgi:hypothetical protein
MRFILIVMAVGLVAVAQAQPEPAISGRWGRDGRTLLDLDADAAGVVAGNVYFHGSGSPVPMPIGDGRFDARSGALELEGELTLPGGSTPTEWVIRGTLVESTLNVDLIMGATRNIAALTRMPRPEALEPGTCCSRALTGAWGSSLRANMRLAAGPSSRRRVIPPRRPSSTSSLQPRAE